MYISIIFCIFVVIINFLQKNINMHNFHAKYMKILDICKKFSKNLVNELGNVPRRGVVPKFSDLEVIALSLTAESLSMDSENCLFVRLNHHRDLSRCAVSPGRQDADSGSPTTRQHPPLASVRRKTPTTMDTSCTPSAGSAESSTPSTSPRRTCTISII